MAGISISARFAWMWIQLPRVEEDCRELGITDTSATSVVVRLTGATVAGKELGVWVLLSSGRGVGSQATLTAAQFSAALSTTVTRRLESFLPPPLLLLFSKTVDSDPMVGEAVQYCMHFMLFLSSASSVCSSPPTFRCTDV